MKIELSKEVLNEVKTCKQLADKSLTCNSEEYEAIHRELQRRSERVAIWIALIVEAGE